MITKRVTLLVGPPGSGKSTLAKEFCDKGGVVYINQDKQGKEHLHLFDLAILEGKSIVVDRMNFSKGQRARYLDIARSHGYSTHITVLHESYNTCLTRIRARKNHETIKDEKACRGALQTFFTKYERVTDDEADVVLRCWPEGVKEKAIICDLDGTLCNIDHRLFTVRPPKEWEEEVAQAKLEKRKNIHGWKADWASFFYNIPGDTINQWCADIVEKFSTTVQIVYCSGRPDDHKRTTLSWLENNLLFFGHLYMRPRGDHRDDSIIKEILLDFEILTRFDPYFAIDDRARVVAMWRKRGIVTLACHEGDF